jgi:D-aminopeptidase
LTIAGAPVGRELRGSVPAPADGSIIIVIATDAPVDSRTLRRMATRSIRGLARTGSSGSNGSGDYAVAFSTVRNAAAMLSNDETSPLFLGVIEATEEAICNSLFKAVAMTGNGHTVEALPVERTREILKRYSAVP